MPMSLGGKRLWYWRKRIRLIRATPMEQRTRRQKRTLAEWRAPAVRAYCSYCEVLHDKTAFGKQARAKAGLLPNCRFAVNELQRVYRRKCRMENK